MVPAKPLICGVAAVGTVSAGAVVANQYGLFSSTPTQSASGERTEAGSDESTSLDGAIPVTPQNPVLPPAPAVDSRTNKEKIKEWLNNNNGSSWKIQIKKEDSQSPVDFNSVADDNDLKDLADHLNSSKWKDLLTSLFAAVDQNTLTFKKPNTKWKILLTKAQVEKWVETTSSSKASLQISSDGSTKTNLENISENDWETIFNDLHANINVFKITDSSISSSNKKTILFEKVDSNWKHSKTEIDGWLTKSEWGNNKFDLKIKKESPQTLDATNEDDLIGLLNYLTTGKEKLLKLKNPTGDTKVTLILKKDTSWDVIHDQNTINNWVSDTSSERVTLEFWKDTSKETNLGEEDFKKIFALLEQKTSLFNSNLDGHNKSTKKTIIFEKVDSNWKHIKDAVKEWLKSNAGGNNKFTIKIQKESASDKKDVDDLDDSELTGLLKHLKDSGSSYSENGKTPEVTLQKDSTSHGWKKL